MTAQTNSASDRLATLLDTWVGEAFPELSHASTALEQMWLALATMLSSGGAIGSQGKRLEPFFSELTSKRQSGNAGSAPIQALRQRIQELTEQGVREFFLVLSIRHALDYLIQEHFSAQYPLWQHLEEHLLPLSLTTETSAGEVTIQYRYGSFGSRNEKQ